jgi:ABC-type Mn2+/Zn2+ transport system permease subunit
LINNLIIYGIFAIIAVAFLLYLSYKGKLNMEELTPLMMAASNAFGMFLVVIFLSHGLVALPK